MRKKVKRCKRVIKTTAHQSLKKIRIESGLTLKEAGNRLGLSLQAVAAIEQGRVDLTEARISEILESYGISMMEFKRVTRVIEKGGKVRRKVPITVMTNQDRERITHIVKSYGFEMERFSEALKMDEQRDEVIEADASDYIKST